MEPAFKHLSHLRSFQRQPIIFLTVCAWARRPLLANHEVHAGLRDIWEKDGRNYGWFIGRYVLMPDHVHLFAKSALDARPLAQWVQTWKSLSSRLIMRIDNVRPPIWQKDYFDRFLRSADSYSKKWDYVVANPQRAGLITRSQDWPFSGVIHELEFRE